MPTLERSAPSPATER
jgi:hypothetical protein